jgi:hypothetical protein
MPRVVSCIGPDDRPAWATGWQAPIGSVAAGGAGELGGGKSEWSTAGGVTAPATGAVQVPIATDRTAVPIRSPRPAVGVM